MITIKASTPERAWRKSFLKLIEHGYPVEFNKFYLNETAAIEISNINIGLTSEFFPMDKDEIQNICKYLLTGLGTINHDWTKLYRKRLFEEEDHIINIIDTLKSWPDCPRAQIALWKNTDLDRNKIAPCLQLLWFKIVDTKLHLHVHMRTSDCYGKLLMNFNEFICIQKYVADSLKIEYGPYTHFIDSLHFHEKDKKEIKKLEKIIND